MSVTKMLGKDAIFAALAECYITIGDKRYNFMQAINLEATIEKNKTEVPILGQTGKGNKAAGWAGSGSMEAHLNQSVFRNLMADYIKDGTDVYFDIKVTNNDPSSEAGRQTVWLKNCNMDNVIAASFDSDGEYLTESMDFTFDDYEVVEGFSELTGFVLNDTEDTEGGN